MSKIIEKGKYPEENKITCKSCNCIFQYYNSEIIVDSTTPDEAAFFGGYGVHRYIKCPQCNNICTISTDFFEDEPLLNGLKKWFKSLLKKKGADNIE